MTLRANHFRISLGEDVHVFQYALTIRPDDMFDSAIVHEILAQKNRHLFKILGAYMPSGQMIFTMAPIAETLSIETTFKNKPCQIVIEKSSETMTLLNPEFLNKQNSVVQGIFNIIFKTAFRQTHLRQIGRDPKFFDYERPVIDDKLSAMRL